MAASLLILAVLHVRFRNLNRFASKFTVKNGCHQIDNWRSISFFDFNFGQSQSLTCWQVFVFSLIRCNSIRFQFRFSFFWILDYCHWITVTVFWVTYLLFRSSKRGGVSEPTARSGRQIRQFPPGAGSQSEMFQSDQGASQGPRLPTRFAIVKSSLLSSS